MPPSTSWTPIAAARRPAEEGPELGQAALKHVSAHYRPSELVLDVCLDEDVRERQADGLG